MTSSITRPAPPVSLLKGHPHIEIYFSSKYDSAREEIIADLADTFLGYGSASTGSVDCCRYSNLVHLEVGCDLDFADTSTNYRVGDPVGEVARTYGVTGSDVMGWHIVSHDEFGFVHVQTYPDTFEGGAQARADFEELEHQHAVHSVDE